MSHTTLLLSCLILAFTLTSCGGDATADQKTPTVEASVAEIDPRKEEKEIVNLIKQETAAFAAKDVDKLLNCYISDGRFSRIQQLPRGQGMLKEGGALEGMRESLSAYFVSTGESVFEVLERVNMDISYSEDNSTATVTYTEVANNGGQIVKSEQIRVMEKENGAWKILLVSSIMH